MLRRVVVCAGIYKKKNFQSSFFAFTRRFGARLKFFSAMLSSSEWITFVNASLSGDGEMIHDTRQMERVLTFLILVLSDIYPLCLWFACRYPCGRLFAPSCPSLSCQTAASSLFLATSTNRLNHNHLSNHSDTKTDTFGWARFVDHGCNLYPFTTTEQEILWASYVSESLMIKIYEFVCFGSLARWH